MGIRLLLCVLPFGVEQDFLLNFLDGGIACKNIWVCHILSLFVKQDFHLNCLKPNSTSTQPQLNSTELGLTWTTQAFRRKFPQIKIESIDSEEIEKILEEYVVGKKFEIQYNEGHKEDMLILLKLRQIPEVNAWGIETWKPIHQIYFSNFHIRLDIAV